MEEKEEKVIINDAIDGLLKEFEVVLGKAMPVKANADLVNQVIYSTLSEKTKEQVIRELLESSKEAIGCQNKEEMNTEEC